MYETCGEERQVGVATLQNSAHCSVEVGVRLYHLKKRGATLVVKSCVSECPMSRVPSIPLYQHAPSLAAAECITPKKMLILELFAPVAA